MKQVNVIVIGAPRSGTNMLRDVLTSLTGVASWPCDEINYIWRHGNVFHKSDEFDKSLATHRVCTYIRKQFRWVARKYSAQVVVEKTCANSLRLPFVDAVVPDAKYIFVHRNGLDVVSSAMKRWNAAMDWRYLARKARFVPATDIPYYAGRYLWNRIYRVLNRDGRLAFWGPQLADMDELLMKYPLDEVCALQWQKCVQRAQSAFSSMPTDRWHRVVYEDFVYEPKAELERILQFLEIDSTPARSREAIHGIRSDSVGKGRANMDADSVHRVSARIGSTLRELGYL